VKASRPLVISHCVHFNSVAGRPVQFMQSGRVMLAALSRLWRYCPRYLSSCRLENRPCMRNLRQVPHWTLGLDSAGAPQRMMLMDLVKNTWGGFDCSHCCWYALSVWNMVRNASEQERHSYGGAEPRPRPFPRCMLD
jgi:hypothetical protein